MTDYDKSRSLEIVPELNSCSTSLKRLIIEFEDDSPSFREKAGQDVISEVCKRLKIPSVKLHVREKAQLHRNNSSGHLKSKTLGRYWHSGSRGVDIEIWNLTAKIQKRVSNKTFWNTLIHELCHHIDCSKLGITSSPHTAGFYKRIEFISTRFD